MIRIIRCIAIMGAVKLASSALALVKNSPGAPRPVKWGATAALALFALKK